MTDSMTDAMRDGAPLTLRDRIEDQLSRTSKSPLGKWFRDIDRVLLLLAMLLIAIGLVAVAAASPATAERLTRISGRHVAPNAYFLKQAFWVLLSVPAMLIVSMLPWQYAKRGAIIATPVLLTLTLLTPYIGVMANGSHRWIDVGIGQFQPSEFLKPVFIVTMAFLLSWRTKEPDLPVVPITFGMVGVVAYALMSQPDLGQTVVFATVWLVLLVVMGIGWRWIVGLLGAGAGGLVAAYWLYDVARDRINTLIFPDEKAAAILGPDQIELAHRTLTRGGLFGAGPASGEAKASLPEAHTDYIFAVIGEEFGLIACGVIVVLMIAVVIRVMIRLLDEEEPFHMLAGAGLAAQFGIQALINMGVATGVLPSKGMTLPFISYGGSSMLALSIGMGLLLAFTRRNPYLHTSNYGVQRGKG